MTAEDASGAPEGYVYVATNEAMPGIVKIGSTTRHNPKSRISQLFTTSVPYPFDMVYAAGIADDPSEVEQALHKAFEPHRLNPRREFFSIEPEHVIAILKLLDVADVTEKARSDVEAELDPEDQEAWERAKRRPWFDFDKLGLRGSVLSFVRDDMVKVEVAKRRQVRVVEVPDGKYPPAVVVGPELWHLSPLTKALLGVKWGPQPGPWWRDKDGRRLTELYDEWWASRLTALDPELPEDGPS